MNDLEIKLQSIANGENIPFENYTEQDWQTAEWDEEMNEVCSQGEEWEERCRQPNELSNRKTD